MAEAEKPQGARDVRRMMDEPVNLNRADYDQLVSIEGIGDGHATQILDWRARNGAFDAIEDLEKLPGFTPDVVASIRDHVRV